ncbi:hypothetical protein [Micromonospora zamorensis]|uniref:hypothetical protein n=1 Tax=Micromonospora zamorensis TaxID=709883 RepID=UPI0033BCF5FD
MADDAAVSLFQIAEDLLDGDHRFVRLVPVDPEGLAEALAPQVQRAYFDVRQSEAKMRAAIADLKHFSSTTLEITESAIREALEEELDAVLPAEWKAATEGGKARPQETAVQRSELAEIIAGMVLQDFFETVIPAARIAQKEVPDQQTRGVDVLGIEGIDVAHLEGFHLPSLALVLGEVKGSCSAASPPAVVRDMEKTLKGLVQDRRKLSQELIWLRDNCSEEHQRICAMILAGYQLKQFDPKVVMTPILLRTANTAGDKDMGKFRTNTASFSDDIRFVTVVLEADDLFNFAVQVYRKARELVTE